MTDKEWKDILAGLNQNFQLTRYKQKLYNGKTGSIWYIAELNALFLIPSHVRQDDEINQLDLHNYEINHAYDNDNEIIRGFAAIYARLFCDHEDLLQIIEHDDSKKQELIDTISRRLSFYECDGRDTFGFWQETLKRENDKTLWRLLNINFQNLEVLYGQYMRMKFHIDPPEFEPAKTLFNGSKLVWLTDGEDFFERVENIHIKQVLEYDTLSFNYGLHNAACKSGSSYASCFMKVLLDHCCQWTIYRISMDNGDAWNSLDTMNNTDLILAVTHHSVRYDNQKLIYCFGSVIHPYAIYDAYLSHRYSKYRDDLGRLPATARYVDDANYIWHEIYKEEKEAFDNNRLKEILPLSLYEKLEEYTTELLNYIQYKYFGDEPEYEPAPKTKPQALPQWQQILKDLAVPDEYCKQSYGWHNVRIAMYIKALEDCKLLNISERQGAKAQQFYQTLANVFGYSIVQHTIEDGINNMYKSDNRKQTYETEILPLVKNQIK